MLGHEIDHFFGSCWNGRWYSGAAQQGTNKDPAGSGQAKPDNSNN